MQKQFSYTVTARNSSFEAIFLKFCFQKLHKNVYKPFIVEGGYHFEKRNRTGLSSYISINNKFHWPRAISLDTGTSQLQIVINNDQECELNRRKSRNVDRSIYSTTSLENLLITAWMHIINSFRISRAPGARRRRDYLCITQQLIDYFNYIPYCSTLFHELICCWWKT